MRPSVFLAAPRSGCEIKLSNRTRGRRHWKSSQREVAYEHHPGLGFGAAAAGPIRDAIFIPGFRNGKVVSCRFTWSVLFFGPGLQMRSG